MPKYSAKLNPEQQIKMEERIAYHLFETYGVRESNAQDAGKDVLLMVLMEFRKDLIEK